jgi:hypothetical protein
MKVFNIKNKRHRQILREEIARARKIIKQSKLKENKSRK